MTKDLKKEFWKQVLECDPADITTESIYLVSDENIDWLLTKQKADFIKMVESKKIEENKFIANGQDDHTNDFEYGFNQALEDLLKEIKEL